MDEWVLIRRTFRSCRFVPFLFESTPRKLTGARDNALRSSNALYCDAGACGDVMVVRTGRPSGRYSVTGLQRRT